MWTQKFCLICIYILRNYAFQISNEALFLAFLQPVANRLKSFILPSNRMGKTSSASTFSAYTLAASNCFSNCHPTHRGGPVGPLADSGVILLLHHRDLQL